jgi:hypothetical protein
MRRTWLVPICLCLITAAGMVSAFLGDGLWDALSWMALAVPLAICIFYWVKSRAKV